MQLLVSVSSAEDAEAALLGGADIIDAKDPHAGPLGAVTVDVFLAIANRVNGRAPLSAALGDAHDEVAISRLASRFAAAGATYVKVGFEAGVTRAHGIRLLQAARESRRPGIQPAPTERGPALQRRQAMIGVSYADAGDRPSPMDLIEMAVAAGIDGVLLDTADKNGPGLLRVMAPSRLAAWVRSAESAGLLAALAGRLTVDDLPLLRGIGAHIAGVRGAACIGGRTGQVSTDSVRSLKAMCDAGPEAQAHGARRR
jgi:uncharacterized protein (UPF0264 family)